MGTLLMLIGDWYGSLGRCSGESYRSGGADGSKSRAEYKIKNGPTMVLAKGAPLIKSRSDTQYPLKPTLSPRTAYMGQYAHLIAPAYLHLRCLPETTHEDRKAVV